MIFMARRKRNPVDIIDLDAPAGYITAFKYWQDTLINIYSSTFCYNNVPDGIDMLFSERWLTLNGLVYGYPVDNVGLVILPANAADQLDVYGYPIKYNVWGMNGYNETVPAANGTPCYDTITKENPLYKINLFANRLAKIDASIDVNADNQKTPYIIKTTEDQLLTVKNMMRLVANGERAIFSPKGKESQDYILDAVLTPAPYVADKLQDTKFDLLSEFLNFCGIFSGAINKAERVTNGENAASLGLIRTARKARLMPREQFCEKFNRKFGTELQVEYNESNLEDVISGLYKIGGMDGGLMDSYVTGYSGERNESNGKGNVE